MSLITWVLVISGVLLNATAQLLLKAATSATESDCIELVWVRKCRPTSAVSLWFVGRHRLLCVECADLDSRAISRAGQRRLSTSVDRLHRQCRRRHAAVGEVLEASKLLGIAVIILGVYILTRSAA